MVNWVKKHKFKLHLFSFSLMISSSLGLHYGGVGNQIGLITVFLIVFVFANILALFIK